MNKKNLSGDILLRKTSFNHFLLFLRTTTILLFLCVFISVEGKDSTPNVNISINKNNEVVDNVKDVQQQQKQISGTILDSQGTPIIGANVIELGTPSNGTITDIDGNFTLRVQNNATIQISYIGYLEQQIATANETTFRVTLVEDTQSLDELIVVGYGVQKK